MKVLVLFLSLKSLLVIHALIALRTEEDVDAKLNAAAQLVKKTIAREKGIGTVTVLYWGGSTKHVEALSSVDWKEFLDLDYPKCIIIQAGTSSKALETWYQHNVHKVGHVFSFVILSPDQTGTEGQVGLFEDVKDSDTYFVFYQLTYSPGLLLHRSIKKLRYQAEVTVTNGVAWATVRAASVLSGPKTEWRPALQELYPEGLNKFLNGTILRVTGSKGTERSGIFTETKGTVDLVGGFSLKIFQCLQQRHGFKYTMFLSRGFGLQLKNGSFTGVVGALQAGKADYGIEAGLNFDRFKVVEYLPPTVFETLTFFTAEPSPKAKWSILHGAFTGSTWAGLTVAASVMAGLMIGIQYVDHSVNTGAEFVIKALLEQGCDNLEAEKRKSVKLMISVWLLVSIVLGTAYKAKLTTLLTYPILETVPADFDELAQSDYEIYLHDLGGLPEAILAKSTNPSLIEIREKMHKEKSLLKCINATLNSRAACIALGLNAQFQVVKHFNSRGRTGIEKAKKTAYSSLPGGPLLRKGLPFAKNFAKTIRNIFDTGLIYKFQEDEDATHKKRRVSKNITSCSASEPRGKDEDEAQPIYLKDIIGVFAVYVVLLLVSMCVFCFEIVKTFPVRPDWRTAKFQFVRKFW